MTADYVKACEDALREHRAQNAKSNILASHNAIIDRLLDRREELVDAYENIASQVQGPHALQSFFDVRSISAHNGRLKRSLSPATAAPNSRT